MENSIPKLKEAHRCQHYTRKQF